MKKLFKILILSCAVMVALPQMANATCYGGCNINIIDQYLDNYFQENINQFKGEKGDKGDSIVGPAGKDGIGIQGERGFTGKDGQSITGPRGYTLPPIGTSFMAAGQSFEGSGVGVGIGGGNSTIEFSIVGGVALAKNIKAVAGFTHMNSSYSFAPDQNRFSAGVGISF